MCVCLAGGYNKAAGGGFNRDGGFYRNDQRREFGSKSSRVSPSCMVELMHRAIADDEGRAFERPHIPTQRPLEEIFAEDLKVTDFYHQIRAEDDDIIVSGPGQDNVAVIE